MSKDTKKEGTPVEQAEKVRKQGLRELNEIGVSVFQTRQEWKDESVEDKERWGRKEVRTLLSKGPGFRVTPQAVTQDEIDIGVLRCTVGMIRKVRRELRKEHDGEKRTLTNQWEAKVGLNMHAVKATKKRMRGSLEEWKGILDQELREGVGFKRQKKGQSGEVRIDIPTLGLDMRKFTRAWTVQEEEVRHFAQVGPEEEERIRAARERDEVKSWNLSEKENRELQGLRNHPRQFRVERADKGGRTVVLSREEWKAQARKHVQNQFAYAPAQQFCEDL